MQRFSRDWRGYGKSTYLGVIAKTSGRLCFASNNMEFTAKVGIGMPKGKKHSCKNLLWARECIIPFKKRPIKGSKVTYEKQFI
jgi:hypothetical protein